MDAQAQMRPTVTPIYRGTGQPKGLFTRSVEEKRVAAYCRVSTLLETQALSLETQMNAFRRKIQEHPGWRLVDVYSDEGVTGTSARKRKAFMRMIADCEAGKVDYIITKSISRFTRNTLECIQYVRYLKGLGVHILFEKENLDTALDQSEMILTILAGFAQEESHSISENVKWGIRKQFEVGQARWCPCYGFRKGEGGQMVLHPAEAEVVRRIFRAYEQGASLAEIAAHLREEGVLTPRGRPFTAFGVSEMLGNEKYKGDAHLQKFRSVDHLTHKSVRNDATEVASYYVTGHHPGIVSPAQFDRVQRIRAMKDNHGGHIPQYPYGGTRLPCPLCGQPLVQRNTRGNHRTRMALGCFGPNGCGQFALRRHLLSAALLKAYAGMDASSLPESADIFRAMKAQFPQMKSVEHFWLDDLVAQIDFAPGVPLLPRKTRSSVSRWDAIIHWRCGLQSIVPIDLGSIYNEPALVAAQFLHNQAKHRPPKEAGV